MRYVLGAEIQEDQVISDRFSVISQNFLMPSDYFQAGAQLPGNARNERFYAYQYMYDGEYGLFISKRDYPIYFTYYNWFQYGADLIRDFLMSSPPESSSAMQEALNKAIRDAITSYIIHGVAVFAVSEGEIEVIKPQYFYPLDDGTVATLNPFGPDRVEVRTSNQSQVHSLDRGQYIENWYTLAGTLGEPVGEPTTEPQRAFYTVAADPADGIFGSSVARKLVNSVANYTAVNNHFISQQRIASQIIHAKRESGTAVRHSFPQEGAEQVAEGKDPIQISRAFGTIVEGYEEFNFVQGTLDSASYRVTLDQAEQGIYDILGISPALVQRFQNTGMGVASGVALERTYIRSAATFKEIIESFRPVMEEILTEVGAPAEIEWNNPLAELADENDMEMAVNEEVTE